MQTTSAKTDRAPKTGSEYEITVQGTISGSYSDRLAGMRITTTSRWDQEPVTVLDGALRDQSELVGVLNSLYELHLPILKVELKDQEEKGRL